jgi:NodT family efflux transporter outer membrane factor (OMF) lipoprotein
MLLVLPSCGIPKLRQAEPAPDLPPTYPGAASPAPDLPANFNGGPGPDQPTDCNGAPNPPNSAQLAPQQFFNDPLLLCLIEQALAGNRELKILEEEVQIASNEVLARQGAYLPFVTFGARTGLDRHSLFTPLGAVEKNVEVLPGQHFPDPVPDYLLGFNLSWQLDIWHELRNARDAAEQRAGAAVERRNYFATQLIAEVAENYYRLLALDKRLETLDRTIALQQKSLELAEARVKAARATVLAVQRFQAEVRKNQSEKPIVQQEIIEVENRINFLVNRFPQPVARMSPAGFFDLSLPALCVGVPAQLLLNRADIRQAERELDAAGLDIKVARAHFFPRLDMSAGVGYEAFNPRYLFNPEALLYGVAGDLVAPLINKKAIKAEFKSANARQLQSLYNYQRAILNAFTEVVNRMSGVANYSASIAVRKQQLEALEASVDTATKLFQAARAEYVEVLLAQRDLLEARLVLIETKKEQLAAVVNAYQALGGGWQGNCGAPSGAPPLPSATTQPVEELPQPRPAPDKLPEGMGQSRTAASASSGPT